MATLKAVPYVPGCGWGKILINWRGLPTLQRSIIVVYRYSLSDILSLSRSKPAGIIIVGMERFSHLLIYLFNLMIPTVLLEEKLECKEGVLAFVDGSKGFIRFSESVNPPKRWLNLAENYKPTELPSGSRFNQPIVTTDGHEVSLNASVSTVEGAQLARKNSAKEIGLVRTEFLWNGTTVPGKKMFVSAMREICKAAAPLRVTMRLLDVGGEKAFEWVNGNSDIREALGLRGCRSYFEPQLRQVVSHELLAIRDLLREFDIGILVPFVTTLDEFIRIRSYIASQIPVSQLRVGAVLETPAACLAIRSFLKESTDLYLGTNDIMECFFGANRTLKSVAHYLVPYSPDLLRFFDLVAVTAGEGVSHVGICGQLPLFPYLVKVLLGMGFRKFSIEPALIPEIAKTVAKHSISNLRDLARKTLACRSAEEVFRVLSGKLISRA